MSEARFKPPGGTDALSALPRRDLRCKVDGAEAVVELSDLSAVGLFVQTREPKLLDTEVAVQLWIADAMFEAHGHVVQSVNVEQAKLEGRKPGYALLFTNIDEAERSRLRRRVDAAIAKRTVSLRPPASLQTRPQSVPTPESDIVLTKLKMELEQITGKPAWAVLGISQGSDANDAKLAFFAASKRYHPHLFARYESPEINKVVTDLFIAHKRAYTSMTRVTGPRQNAALRSSPGPSMPEPSGLIASQDARPSTGGQATPKVVVDSARAVTPTPAPEPPAAVVATRVSERVAPKAPVQPVVQPRAVTDARVRPSQNPLRPPQEAKVRAPDAERFIHDALKHLSQARFDEAERDLDKALAVDASSQKARLWRLVTQARRFKSQSAFDAMNAKYAEVLTLDPRHHEALNETKKNPKDSRGKTTKLLGRLFGPGDGEK